jgi:response regulator RpfG family c-di-GMP phosphodiesterase
MQSAQGPLSIGRTKHVVVLDDDDTVLRAADRLLTGAGYKVTATADPKRAMEIVVCEGADAIVSDLHMPQMGGHLVLAMLAHSAPRAARVLMTSETDFTRIANLMVPYSVHAFVTKKDSAQRLLPTLAELLAGRPEENEQTMSEDARSLARSIVRVLAMRNYESEAHCMRVAAWSRRLAAQLAFSPSRMYDIELGALLHDVGQIGVRDAVLLKPSELTHDEWADLRKHPDLGVSLLRDIPALHRAMPIVQCHHERRDGKGYPRGLAGNAIPVDARIFQIVDAYDSLCSDRPYRAAKSDADARAVIAGSVGPQFDPEVHASFEAIDPEEWAAVTRELPKG